MIPGAALAIILSLALLCGVAGAAWKQSTHRPPAASAPQQSFEQLKKQADEAREGGRLEEAIRLYRRALARRPNWGEGWWSLATLLYDRDEYAGAARAFRQTTVVQPNVGAPWAMLGLCE